MHRPTSALPRPPPSATTTTTTTTPPFRFPPSSIPTPPESLHALPPQLTSPHALRFPASWRCGTCGATHAVLDLIMPQKSRGQPEPTDDDAQGEDTSDRYCCAQPALQAVYDQFGHIYLLWRDDPAVADLRDPRGLREARWRVWKAGGGWWDVVLPGRRFGFGLEGGDGEGVVGEDEEIEGEGGEGVGGRRGGKRPLRRWTSSSQSSMASDASEDSLDAELMAMEQ